MMSPIQTIAGIPYILSPFGYSKMSGVPTILTANPGYVACYHLLTSLKINGIIKQRKDLENFRSTYLKFPPSYIPRIAEAIWEERWKKKIDRKENPLPYIITVVKNMSIAEYKRVQSLFEKRKREIKCPVCYKKQPAKSKVCEKCGADLDEIDKRIYKSLDGPISTDRDPLKNFISKGDKSKEEIQNELNEIIDLKMRIEKINLNPYAIRALLIQKICQTPSFRQAYILSGSPEKYYFAARKDKERKSHLFRQFFN